MSLMPPIKLSAFKRCTLLITSISFNGEIISFYFRYIKKGLVYIIIIDPFSRQPFSYIECTKLNTRALYNVRLVSFNKYTFPYYARRYTC